MELKIEVLEGGKTPIKGTEEAACFDLFVREISQSEGVVFCYLGIKTEIPSGYCAKLYARSNITKTGWTLANGVGVIDSDFRHEWQARFYSVNKNMEFPYKVGERVAQFSIEKVIPIEFTTHSNLEKSNRKGGFGSTDNL